MDSPDVSVIIPVYNAVDYVGQAVASVQSQSISPERVEIVIIDDGSTDGSGDIVRELAREDARIHVLFQENSGTPGGARNPGIRAARGNYVFFLDADDKLTERALERMVDTAIAEGSEVVLGKIASIDGRRVPTSMFRSTVLDADVVRDKVFNTLGPTKLVSKDLIDRLELRFPTDQKVGEDQPFMAAVYLNASKISVLADMDYYLTQHRPDRGNITFTKQDSFAHAEVAIRLSRVIEKYTDPGEVRDALIRRPFDWSLPRAMDRRWNTMSRERQGELAAYIRDSIGYLYTEGVRALVRPETRVRTDLVLSADLTALSEYIKFLSTPDARKIEWRDGDFRAVLPGDLREAVPVEDRREPAPKMTCRLEAVSVAGGRTSVSVSVGIPGFVDVPDRLAVRARHRTSGEVRDAHVVDEEFAPRTENFFTSGEFDQLGRGVWDVFVLVGIGSYEKEIRFGSARNAKIPPEGVSNASEEPSPRNSVLAYFTQGAGNLSIDVGSVLHKDVARADVVGLTIDENARPVAIVHLTRAPKPKDEFFAHLDNTPSYGGRMLLPTVRLGVRTIGLRLPLTAQMQGASLTVSAVLGGEPTRLALQGADFWPARAAGFGLTDIGGTLTVTDVPVRSTARSDLKQALSPAVSRFQETAKTSRRGARSLVKSVPVVGGLATRVAKKLRSGR